MSFKLISKAFDLDVGNATRKLILIKLADQANDEGNCYPSYETLAKACNADRRTVIRHIKKLEEMGLVKIHKRYDKEKQRNSSNIYQLFLYGQNDNKKTTVPSDNLSPPSDNLSPPSDNVTPTPSDNLSPKPVTLEPINEAEQTTPANSNSENKNSECEKNKVSDFENEISVLQIYGLLPNFDTENINFDEVRFEIINCHSYYNEQNLSGGQFNTRLAQWFKRMKDRDITAYANRFFPVPVVEEEYTPPPAPSAPTMTPEEHDAMIARLSQQHGAVL